MAGPLRYRDWQARMAAQGPAAGTFLCGPESLLRDAALRRIKEAVLGSGAGASLGHDRFSADEGPLSQVTLALASVGLFTGSRLVTFSDAEKAARAPVADRKELLASLARGTPGSVFVATSELSVRELERKSDWCRSLLQTCQVVEVVHPTPAEALDWIRQECQRRGLPLAPEAAAYLISRVGPDLQELSRELEKLELAQAPGEKLGLEEVQAMVRRGQLGSGWELCQALLEGKVGDALRQLDAVGRTDAVLRIQWLLQRQARDRAARQGRGGATAVPLRGLLLAAYELEQGIKSGRIPGGLERDALDILVASSGAGSARGGGGRPVQGTRRK